jgi:phage terminase large subunit-like protein
MPFEIKKSQRVRRFIEEECTYSKGEWAGQKFKLLPWQWDEIVKPLFGTVNGDGWRQYRTVFCEIPKKNGKTELCAAIALYMLTYDGEEGAEVYIAAADREQAGLTYMAASAMVRNSSKMMKFMKCLDSRKRIIYSKTKSFLQVLSSESYTKHGLSPSCVIIDEIHAQPNDELYNTLTAGTDYARKQQVILIITTAGIYDKNSIWWRLRTRAQQIRDGIIKDSRFLPVLYIADPEKDDPADEELWKRVNPSLEQIFTLEKIRQDYNEAKQDPVNFQNFCRFRLNIPIRQLSKFMPMDKWDACAGPSDVDSLKVRKCYGGLDLSSKVDLAAFVLVFPPSDRDGIFDVLWKIYCPEEGILKRSQIDRVNYGIWQKEGFLTATPGNVIDYEFIERDVFDAAKAYDLKAIAFDSWNAQATSNRIMEHLNPTNDETAFQMVEMRQGAKSFNEPAKDLLVHVMTGKIRHGGNPVARWCADNLVMRADANDNIAPDKLKATEKIDAMVALMMAWSRAMFREEEKPFVYQPGSISKIEPLEIEEVESGKKEAAKPKSEEIPCGRCGKDVIGQKFCKNCGKKVDI